MAEHLFGEPHTSRTIPLQTTKNLSSNKKHGCYTLSEEMLAYLSAPTSPYLHLYQSFVRAESADMPKDAESIPDAGETLSQFAHLVHEIQPHAVALYTDFLRLIWRYAPDTGIATERMILVLCHRYNRKRSVVYKTIARAEGDFVRTLRQWNTDRRGAILAADAARRAERDARARMRDTAQDTSETMEDKPLVTPQPTMPD